MNIFVSATKTLFHIIAVSEVGSQMISQISPLIYLITMYLDATAGMERVVVSVYGAITVYVVSSLC